MPEFTKAQLYSLDAREYDIEFMYNPSKLDFKHAIQLNQSSGARGQRGGQPKVSFAHPQPCVLTLSDILFDAYEEGEAGADRLEGYIAQLCKAVRFINAGNGSSASSGSGSSPLRPRPTRTGSGSSSGQSNSDERPPIFLFIWGTNDYLRCFVESFQYQLTMFLPNGRPVRAKASLTLKEIDGTLAVPTTRQPPGNAHRFADSRTNREARS